MSSGARSALITGGAGFIGGFLAQALLAAGWRVDILDNLRRGRNDAFMRQLLQNDQARFINGDLLQEHCAAQCDGPYEVIFHFAAILGVQTVLQEPFRTLADNVRLLENALFIARQQPDLQRFVFASTSEVYAGSLENIGLRIPTPESHVIALPDLAKPRTSYMLSKLYGEALVQHSGLPYTIIRPHNVYGPRMGLSHVIPQLLEKAHMAANGSEIEVFSPQHTRTFCFIDDAVEMVVRAATVPQTRNLTLNLGTQDPEYPIAELARLVVLATGKELRLRHGPETEGSPSRRCPDMSLMTMATGYASSVALGAGIAQTYDWYCRNVFGTASPEVAI